MTVRYPRQRTGAELVESARSLIPLLRRRAVDTERAGRIPGETLADLNDAGLRNLMRPARFGGSDISLTACSEIVNLLAQGDASVSWIATVNIVNNLLIPTLYPAATVELAFDDPHTTVTSVATARKFEARWVDGGLHVEEGVWGFNSGVYHSAWDNLFAPIRDPETGAVDARLILVPQGELELLNDWDVVGLRATGSTTVRLRDVFVPADRITLPGGAARNDFGRLSPYQDVPQSVSGALINIGVLLGCAQAAEDVFIEKLAGRSILYSRYPDQRQAPVTHHEIAESSARAAAAAALTRQACAQVEAAVESGRPLTLLERARLRRDTGFAVRACWEAVDILAAASGGSFAASGHPLSRIWRDARVASQHAALATPAALETYGRVRVGLEPETTLI